MTSQKARFSVVVQFADPASSSSASSSTASTSVSSASSAASSSTAAPIDRERIVALCAAQGLDEKVSDEFATVVLNEGGESEPSFANPTKKQRAAFGRVCAALALEFETIGSAQRQRFVIRGRATSASPVKNEGSLTISCDKGYVFAAGPPVEAAAKRFLGVVPAAWSANRRKRDGAGHHITLLSKHDLAELSVSRDVVMRTLVDALSEGASSRAPFHVEGVGSVSERGDNTAVFVVVDLPELAVARERLGLKPHDPHITLGFKRADIHGVAKNASTLLPSESDADVEALTARLGALDTQSTASAAPQKAKKKK